VSYQEQEGEKYEIRKEMLYALHRNGVPLLAGDRAEICNNRLLVYLFGNLIIKTSTIAPDGFTPCQEQESETAGHVC
jgi:hypothetical protein